MPMSPQDLVVHVDPDGRRVTHRSDRTLLDSLLEAEVPIAHACGGKARCTTCRVHVSRGLDSLAPRTDAEAAFAERMRLPDDVRLACQARPAESVSIRRLVLDDVDRKLTTRIVQEPQGSVGEEIEAAVLFADLAGFTTLSEQLPAYDVMYLLNRWFFLVGEEIEAVGGHIDNYMGDGLLAVFDQGDAHECTLAAVRAGLAMLRVADELSVRVQKEYGSPFGVRVGIHLGDLIAGTLGACHQRRETVIGDTVNIASRIESANKQAGTRLLVSCVTLQALGDSVEVGRHMDAELKGKSGSFHLHEIVGLSEAPA